MNVEYWFPTVTIQHDVDAHVKHTTKLKIDSWMKQGAHKEYLESCKEDNLSTSYFKHHDTLSDLNLTELHEEILKCALVYTQHMGLQVDALQLRVDSWINFFEPNQSEQQHNHYGNFLSGTYYVQGEPHSGCYRFFDPAVQKTMWKGIYLQGCSPSMSNLSSGEYTPLPGKMILFPSWLDHAVMANKSDQTRISIAFNINPTQAISV